MGLCSRIVSMCKDRGISVAALEKELGLGKATIYRWEDKMPSIDKVQKVAEFFDVSVDYLLGRVSEDDETVEELRERLHKDSEYRALLSASAKLQVEDIKAVMAIIERMNRE